MNIVFALMIIFNTSSGTTSQLIHFQTENECKHVLSQVINLRPISTIGCMKVVK
jgi:hypothetical protein